MELLNIICCLETMSEKEDTAASDDNKDGLVLRVGSLGCLVSSWSRPTPPSLFQQPLN